MSPFGLTPEGDTACPSRKAKEYRTDLTSVWTSGDQRNLPLVDKLEPEGSCDARHQLLANLCRFFQGLL